MSMMKTKTTSSRIYCGASYMKYPPHQSFCTQTCRQRDFWKTLRRKAIEYDKTRWPRARNHMIYSPRSAFNLLCRKRTTKEICLLSKDTHDNH